MICMDTPFQMGTPVFSNRPTMVSNTKTPIHFLNKNIKNFQDLTDKMINITCKVKFIHDLYL